MLTDGEDMLAATANVKIINAVSVLEEDEVVADKMTQHILDSASTYRRASATILL